MVQAQLLKFFKKKTTEKVNVSLKGFSSKMRMVLSETPLKEFGHSDCKTEGWAEQVINQWEITASEVPKKDYKPRTNALRFYGREKFVRETLNSWSGTSDTTKKDKVGAIHFHKSELCGTTQHTFINSGSCSEGQEEETINRGRAKFSSSV